MRLAECLFSDIYVTTEMNKMPVIRDLEYTKEDGERELIKNVVTPPKDLFRDIAVLFKMIMAQNKDSRNDEMMVSYDEVNYRCSRIIAPTGMGPRKDEHIHTWCIRRITKDPMPFYNIGFEPKVARMLTDLSYERGLLMVCGSFGSGKTTSASSLFKHWVTSTNEVGITLEDPPEFDLAMQTPEGTIFQIDLTDRSMEDAIKKLRRWAPRYVFLGEIRNAESAQELLQISQSGPMTMATIHASNPVSAITSLVRFASARMSENDARDLIARTLKGVIYQTLDNKVFKSRYLSVGKDEDFGIRTKIILGDFQRIDEALEAQEKNR